MRAYLAGGPRHGDVYELGHGQRDLVFAVNFPVAPLFEPAPQKRPAKPSWTTWLFHYNRWAKEYVAWKYWEPKPVVCKDVTFEQIVYRLKWRNPAENSAIFWYEGTLATPPSTGNEVYHYLWKVLSEAQRAHHGMLNDLHWEMGHDWFRAIWTATLSGPPIVQDGDTLTGLPVKVTGPQGAPRIVQDEKVYAA